ncbi:unnamed protein product, partial [Rotaria magnacalcarata]
MDTSETMNMESSRPINISIERSMPEAYPYSSYEQISTDQKYIPSTAAYAQA